MRRVVITGIGIVSSIGNDVDEVTQSLMNGVSGIISLSLSLSITFEPSFSISIATLPLGELFFKFSGLTCNKTCRGTL